MSLFLTPGEYSTLQVHLFFHVSAANRGGLQSLSKSSSLGLFMDHTCHLPLQSCGAPKLHLLPSGTCGSTAVSPIEVGFLRGEVWL